MADRVERLRKVDGHGHGAEGWSGLIKAHDHLVCERKKPGGGGVILFEPTACATQLPSAEDITTHHYKTYEGVTTTSIYTHTTFHGYR